MDIDIKELNKTQLILLTLLITFIVSIATGIITVSLMQQMPKSVPQTINNVIQRTIEKVTTVPAETTTDTSKSTPVIGDGDVVVPIYAFDVVFPAKAEPVLAVTGSTVSATETKPVTQTVSEPKPLGHGIIISDVGLVLVDSNILTDSKSYKVVLNNTNFDATIIQKFGNGFTILKISPQKESQPVAPTETKTSDSKVDIKI